MRSAHVFSSLLGGLGLLLLFSPAAVAGSGIFSDDFGGSTLDPAWQVMPGAGSYSLTGGNLQYFNQGSQSAPGGWVTTSMSLALPFSGTDWQVDTKATYNLGWLNGSGSSSGAQRSLAMVSFNTGSLWSDIATFDRGIDAYYNANSLAAYYTYGASQVNSPELLDPLDKTVVGNIADGTYWLRLVRHGGSLTMSYSRDGSTWSTGLGTTLGDASQTNSVLLLSGQTYMEVGSYTKFDFVTITALDANGTPEPGSLMLMGAGLAGLAAAKKWRGRRS